MSNINFINLIKDMNIKTRESRESEYTFSE